MFWDGEQVGLSWGVCSSQASTGHATDRVPSNKPCNVNPPILGLSQNPPDRFAESFWQPGKHQAKSSTNTMGKFERADRNKKGKRMPKVESVEFDREKRKDYLTGISFYYSGFYNCG